MQINSSALCWSGGVYACVCIRVLLCTLGLWALSSQGHIWLIPFWRIKVEKKNTVQKHESCIM